MLDLQLPVRAATLGDIGIRPTDKQTSRVETNYREGRLCPVCLEPITNTATTCRDCKYEWQRIQANWRDLAWWVYQATLLGPEERAGLRHIRVWEKT